MRLMSDTKEVTVKGVKFTIKVISRRVWAGLEARAQNALNSYKNLSRVLSTVKDVAKADASELTAMVIEGMTPDEMARAQEVLFNVHFDMVKYGVDGHDGLTGPNGEVIMPVKDGFGVLTDAVVELYDLNGYLASLASEVSAFNKLSEQDQKN